MYIITFLIGVLCGTICMALASVSKDSEITEKEEKELLEYIERKDKENV